MGLWKIGATLPHTIATSHLISSHHLDGKRSAEGPKAPKPPAGPPLRSSTRHVDSRQYTESPRQQRWAEQLSSEHCGFKAIAN